MFPERTYLDKTPPSYYPPQQPNYYPNNCQNYPNSPYQDNINPNYKSSSNFPMRTDQYSPMSDKYRPFSVNPQSDPMKFQQDQYRQFNENKANIDIQRRENNNYIYQNVNIPLSNQREYNKRQTPEMSQRERERQRKMEYNKILQQQIEEKKKIKEIERKKQMEEDLKYENRYKQQVLEEQRLQQQRNISNQTQMQKQSRNIHSFKTDPNAESSDNIMSNNHFVTTSPNFHNVNNNNNNLQGYQMQMTFQNNENSFPLYSTQESTLNKTQQPIRNEFTARIDEEACRQLVNSQYNYINEFEIKIGQFPDDSGGQKKNIETIKEMLNERNLTMEKIQNEQEVFRERYGYEPAGKEFNNKIALLLEKIIESKLERIGNSSNKTQVVQQMQNEQYNYEQNDKMNNNQQINISNKINSNNNNNNNLYNNSSSLIMKKSEIERPSTSQYQTNNINLEGCYYRSKYEELVKSNFGGEDTNPEFKMSMMGFSKMVMQNQPNAINNSNNNRSMLYKTWREDIVNNNNNNSTFNNNNSKISNVQNQNNSQLKSVIPEEKEPNISQSKILNDLNDQEENQFNIIENPDLIQQRRIESARPGIFPNQDCNNSLLFNSEIDKINLAHSYAQNENSFNFDKPNQNIKDNSPFEQEYTMNIGNISQIPNKNSPLNNNSSINNNLSIVNQQSILNQRKMPINKEEEDEEYGNDFEKDDPNKYDNELEDEGEKYDEKFEKEDVDKLEKNNDINLDDYKEIRESQKLETQMNFFEDSMEKINLNSHKQHLVRPGSPKLKGTTSNNEKDGDFSRNINIMQSSELSINPIQDSYGDNIINALDRYRKMALEEQSFSNQSKIN